jgi:pimeloyl-ACP methyl ester carboxylesterase
MRTMETTHRHEGFVSVGDAELFFVQQGAGPDVVLIAGLSDPAEAWEPQLQGLADRYRVTAFDNRGAGRSPMPPDGFTVMDMADDAAALVRGLGLGPVHVAGFSGGSVTAQQVAHRHPELVRSLVLQSTWAAWDGYVATMVRALRWMLAAAPSEREALEAFFLWIYTPRAHNDGTVSQLIDEALAFPHPQSPEGFTRQLDAWAVHDSRSWLSTLDVPTLVLAGEVDPMTRPELGQQVADAIPGATFRVLAGEAHQPFQEDPETWNRIVDDFWTSIDGRR